MRLLAKNISEIAQDKALRIYGAFLGVSYLATYLFFIIYQNHLYLTQPSEAICWPFFPNCHNFHFFSEPQAQLSIHLLGLLSLAFTLSFIWNKIKTGYFLLLITWLYELSLITLDFRFRQNQHYMLLWTTLAYLFIPKKREALTFLIISFYWWAGRLKINGEWLSGSIIYKDMWLIPSRYFPIACIYVVVLELIFIWALAVRKSRFFWPVYAQLILFHIISWSQVGFYYPILMAGIISVFPLFYYHPSTERSVSDLLRGKLEKSTYALILLFGFLQMIPLLYPGDSTLVGQGRIFALHMFEARQKCEVIVIEKFKNRIPLKLDLAQKDLPPRIMCEPILYFNRVQNQCLKLKQNPQFMDLDFYMNIAKATMPSMKPLISTQDFCSQNLRYHPILPNSWILPVYSEE